MSMFPSGRRNPFWSAIITQTQGDVDVPHATFVYVDIQPPAMQTWQLWIDTCIYTPKTYLSYLWYYDYDGTTRRLHHGWTRDTTTNVDYGHFFSRFSTGLLKILTNALYASLMYWQNSGYLQTVSYGYSGFKLSQPLWSSVRAQGQANPLIKPKPWKRKPSKLLPLPRKIKALEPDAFDRWNDQIRDYELSIMLEEDTPLAVDPETGFAIERLTACIKAEDLVNLLNQRDEPTLRPDVVLEAPPKCRGRNMRELTKEEFEEVTGYKKYFDKWRDKGISL